MEDQLIKVDIYDREIGCGGKMEIHRKGELHRAFSVFLVDGDRMLIQRRNPDKYHSGGLWANSCCSHPRKGEALEEAVNRRLEQELGVTALCRELFSFVYFTRYSDQMFEYEFDHVFLGRFSEEREIPFDPEEIAEVKWVDCSWLEQDLAENPQRYSSWFLIAAPRVLQFLRETGKRNRMI